MSTLGSELINFSALQYARQSKGPQLFTGCGHFLSRPRIARSFTLHIRGVPGRETPHGGWPAIYPSGPPRRRVPNCEYQRGRWRPVPRAFCAFL